MSDSVLYVWSVIGEDFVTEASLTIALSAIDFNSNKCVNITTNADMIVEGNEVFIVIFLSANQPNTMVTPNSQVATILDNTSRFCRYQ